MLNVIDALSDLCIVRSIPTYIRIGNRSEFNAEALRE